MKHRRNLTAPGIRRASAVTRIVRRSISILARSSVVGTVAVSLVHASALLAQAPVRSDSTESDSFLTASLRNEVLDGAVKNLRQWYLSPDAALKAENALRQHQRIGDYDRAVNPTAFAALLTHHLQEQTHDKHLTVTYSPQPLAPSIGVHMVSGSGADSTALSSEEQEATRKGLSRVNYGFRQVAVLDGNVGYLNLVGFAPAEIGWDAAVATMGLLANTDALIIDLRENTGGSPQMATLLATYLLGSRFKPVHLNDIYWRPTNSTEQYWTLPYVPGKLYGGKDVYLLTSTETFSTAEEFAYDLKALNRVTIIGERTAGGAHVGLSHRLTDHFAMFVPSGQSVNPITKTNWEGAGITPDIPASAQTAPAIAHVTALKKLIERTSDSATTEDLKRALEQAEAALAAQGR